MQLDLYRNGPSSPTSQKTIRPPDDLWCHYLVQTLIPQVAQGPEDAGRQRLPRLLNTEEQGNAEHPPAFRLRRLGLPQRFGDGPAGRQRRPLDPLTYRDAIEQQKNREPREKLRKLMYAQQLFSENSGEFCNCNQSNGRKNKSKSKSSTWLLVDPFSFEGRAKIKCF